MWSKFDNVTPALEILRKLFLKRKMTIITKTTESHRRVADDYRGVTDKSHASHRRVKNDYDESFRKFF